MFAPASPSLVRGTEHFYEIGLDPTFGIIDADEAKLLKTEILEKTINWAWKQNNIADGRSQAAYDSPGFANDGRFSRDRNRNKRLC